MIRLRFLFAVCISSVFALSFGFHIQPKVVNGDLSNVEDFPFFVVLEKNGRPICGGSIISNRWILAAAHCVSREKDIQTHLGVVHVVEPEYELVACLGIDSLGQCKMTVNVPSSNRYIDPLHDRTTIMHDLALLELHTPITFDRFIQPVKMTDVCDSPHAGGMEVIAAGTGTYMHFQYTQRSELRLRQASFVTIDSVHCLDYLTHKNRVNPDAIICAHVNGNDQAVYTGDSGGPLLSKNDGSLIGTMSFVEGPYNNITMQVFTNLPYYYEWIEQQTGISIKLSKCSDSQVDGVA